MITLTGTQLAIAPDNARDNQVDTADNLMACPRCNARIFASSTGRIWCPLCRNGARGGRPKTKRPEAK
jgi:uncharacterized Zn finger protein (UPF0148 family)